MPQSATSAETLGGRDLPRVSNGDRQVAKQSVTEPVNPAVHGKALTPVPGVARDSGLANVCNLLDHIEFAKAIDAL